MFGRGGDVCRHVGREQRNLVLFAEQIEGFFAIELQADTRQVVIPRRSELLT